MFTPDQVDTFNKLIHNAKKIGICGHIDPDGDCIGACLGIGKWLENQGRQACYFVPTKPSEVFDFLPTITSFQTHIPSQYTPDLRISLDTAERHRSNLAERNTEKPILHIDHHPTDQGRGTINFVNDAVNSTCELVLFLLEQQNTSDITPEIATYLFLGISTDTGHFMWGKDLQNGFGAAQRLVGYGANHQAVIQHIYRNNEFTGIQFIGTLLERMQREEQLIRTWFSATELSARNLDESKIEGLLSIMTSIKHEGIFLFFKGCENEESPYLKCSLRTENPTLDVAALAKEFGGGGHKAAAGCRVFLEGKPVGEVMENMRATFSRLLKG